MWTSYQISYLRQHYSSKTHIDEICTHLSKSRRAVFHKAARLGLSRLRVPYNKPKDLNHRRLIDRTYYAKNRARIYKAKRNRILLYKKELISLLGGACQRCGYNKCPAAFDFHHAFGKKEGMIATMLNGASKEKLLKEAQKCTLLCANCHREAHYKGL